MIADLNNNFVFLQIVDRMRHMLASKVNKSVVFFSKIVVRVKQLSG